MIPNVPTRPNGQQASGPVGQPGEPAPAAPAAQPLPVRSIPPASHPPHRYSLWALSLLGAGALFYEIVAWVFAVERPELLDVALFVYLGVVVSVLALDWRHFLTLHGHIHWQALSWPARLGIVLMYTVLTVLIFSLPVLYLAFAVKDTLDARRASPDAHVLRTAQLEAELGILPGVEGECPQCHRPLQAGAEYCMYCGAGVSQKARVCPACAATASPDAQFCPHCGMPFVGPDRVPRA